MPYNPGIPLPGRCPREKYQMCARGKVASPTAYIGKIKMPIHKRKDK